MMTPPSVIETNEPRKPVRKNRARIQASVLGSINAACPCAMRRFSHIPNSPTTTQPASTSQITGESSSHSGEPGPVRTNPDVLDFWI